MIGKKIENFTREIRWEKGYDYRDDPKKKEYGCHGMNIRFLLHGPEATIQFLLFTNWLPTWKSIGEGGRLLNPDFGPLPADLGYHSDEKHYGDTNMKECDCRPSGKCYYSGSMSRSEEAFKALLKEEEEGLWKFLEEEYNRLTEENEPKKGITIDLSAH